MKERTVFLIIGFFPRMAKSSFYRIKHSGEYTEIMKCRQYNTEKHTTVQKLTKGVYIDKSTQEIKEAQKYASRADDMKAVCRALNNGRDIILANVTDERKALFLTLTYAKSMTDSKRLARDIEYFITKMRRLYQSKFEYIAVSQLQKNGNWHMHLIFIFHEVTEIKAKSVFELWGNGSVHLSKVTNVLRLANYLTSKKKYPLEALSLYPPQMHIFRFSQGIKKPVVFYTTREEAQKISKGKVLVAEQNVNILHSFLHYERYKNP